jgi:hypothetical protein
MKILGDYIRGFDFIRMRPDTETVTGGVPAGHRAYVLAEAAKTYALYLARDPKEKNVPTGPQSAALQLALPAGSYAAEWVNPRSGQVDRRESLTSTGATITVASPTFEEDVALRLRQR